MNTLWLSVIDHFLVNGGLLAERNILERRMRQLKKLKDFLKNMVLLILPRLLLILKRGWFRGPFRCKLFITVAQQGKALFLVRGPRLLQISRRLPEVWTLPFLLPSLMCFRWVMMCRHKRIFTLELLLHRAPICPGKCIAPFP